MKAQLGYIKSRAEFPRHRDGLCKGPEVGKHIGTCVPQGGGHTGPEVTMGFGLILRQSGEVGAHDESLYKSRPAHGARPSSDCLLCRGPSSKGPGLGAPW